MQRGYGGVGYQFAQLAERHGSQVVVIGSRGLSGLKALLGSVSDIVVQISPVPVLVVPHPLTTGEWAAATDGPILVAQDGSPGSAQARARAAQLFPQRRIMRASVEDEQNTGTDPDVVHLPRRGVGAVGVAETLSEYAAQQHAVAIVVGSRGVQSAPCWRSAEWPRQSPTTPNVRYSWS
ncbi:universal stress protein [Blastococcus sp. CT_GayMR20]|uniref:universal stress protein n=1 Tax=Blastococcus sp. CT_GayMR20 TaxID=2559609 RepID=UPI00143191C4|nr:universal stress protein [Blastococcus sp. CT_GayMR20]